MEIGPKFFYFWFNPLLIRCLILFVPARFIIRLYLSSIFSSLSSKESVLRVAGGYGKNLKMVLRIGDKSNPQEVHYWLGFYELDIQRLFARIVKKGAVVYDIGAYIGFYSLLAGRLTGADGRVYAFEPLPNNIRRIKFNISLNGMQGRVTCIPKAVADKSGEALYYDFNRDDWSRFMRIRYYSGDNYFAKGQAGQLFGTISLDEFVFQEGHPVPDLIKIDVEGQERTVLAGAQRLLKEFRPLVICELHYPESVIQIYEELIHLGYKIEQTKPSKRINIKHPYHIIARPKE